MEQAIGELLAKQEITETLFRIARATDRGDPELYAAGFHEDGEDFHGLSNGPVGNTIRNLAKTQLLLTQHAISNVLIEFEGDIAWAESCFTSFHQGRSDDGSLRDEVIRGAISTASKSVAAPGRSLAGWSCGTGRVSNRQSPIPGSI